MAAECEVPRPASQAILRYHSAQQKAHHHLGVSSIFATEVGDIRTAGYHRRMDPHQVLGLARSCTREEAKEAFLAKAASAHPDHGGEEVTFIQLRAAYEQVLAELDRRRRPVVDPPSPPHRTASRRPLSFPERPTSPGSVAFRQSANAAPENRRAN